MHGELPQVRLDHLPVTGELRRVLVSFFDDVGRILEVRPPTQERLAVDPGSKDDPREDALQSLRPSGVRARNLKE